MYDHIAINWLNIGYLEAITGPLNTPVLSVMHQTYMYYNEKC